MQLYNKQNIHCLNWHETENSDYARRVLLPFMEKGPQHYIKNADVQLEILAFDEHRLPLVLPEINEQNSYVCSPTGQYIRYGHREIELELHDKFWAKTACQLLLKGFEKLAISKDFDQVVFVNNWLVSTNLYPSLSKQELKTMTDFLVAKFPDRAIIFRSVNPVLNKEIFDTLSQSQYRQVLSRQVWLLDPKTGAHRKKKAFKEDRRFRKKRLAYQWTSDILPAHLPFIRDYYNDLYLKKYSNINPAFTPAFYSDALEGNWLNFRVLLKEEKPHACLAYFDRNGVMTTPIIGYDRSLPLTEGFYRLISLQIIEEGEKEGKFIHESSGAAEFKRLRGAEPCIEYNMVYTKHLSSKRQRPWQILEQLTQHVVGPIVKHYQL